MSDAAARLVVRQGPYPNQEYLLTQAATVMGRGPNNDLVFADPEISRQHAQIVIEENGQYVLKDLGSTNGLFVNGRRVSGTALLNSGDTISLGESIILVFYLPGVEFYSEDDTPTGELEPPPSAPSPALADMEAASAADYPPIAYAAPPAYAQTAPSGRRGRTVLIGCGVTLLLVFLCIAVLFFLDAYDNGRLLYCGGLRSFWEAILSPFGFAPLCN